FGRGRRDAVDFPGAGVGGASRNNRERDQRVRAGSGHVVERLWLPQRNAQSAAEIPVPVDSQRVWRRRGGCVIKSNSPGHIRRAGSVSDSVRYDSVYDPGDGSTMVAVGGKSASGGERELAGWGGLLPGVGSNLLWGVVGRG